MKRKIKIKPDFRGKVLMPIDGNPVVGCTLELTQDLTRISKMLKLHEEH